MSDLSKDIRNSMDDKYHIENAYKYFIVNCKY